MEQSFEETAAASSPPKKKRGRPKKADKVPTPAPVVPVPVPQSEATSVAKDVPKLRRKKRKGFSKSVSGSGKKKRQQQGIPASSKPPPQSDFAATGPTAETKVESAPADVKVGQSVHGVVDGAFDAGYLVTVRVGDAETVFRGVVFGPGLSLPLNRDNDVAPKMKRVIRDDVPEVAASSVSLSEAAPVPATSIAASPHAAPVPATVPVSSPLPPANEAHRIAAMAGSAGMGYQAPVPGAPPSAAGSYTPPVYRSPSFAPGQMHNAPGGFYYAPPTHSPSPNANHGQGGYYPLRGFPYPFHFPRAEYGGSPQFAGSAASPAPSLQGNLPPRTS